MSEQVSLKEYFEARFTDANQRNEQRFLAQEKAVNAALAAAETSKAVAATYEAAWKAGANEWRGSMSDRERDFARKTDLDALKERIDRQEGSGKGMRDLWGWIVAAGAVAFAVLKYFQ
jgi:hypothetical protein